MPLEFQRGASPWAWHDLLVVAIWGERPRLSSPCAGSGGPRGGPEGGVYNYGSTDPQLEDREGISVFSRGDHGEVFHTYSAYAHGIDMVNGTYQFLDLVPKGGDEPTMPRSSGCAATTSTGASAGRALTSGPDPPRHRQPPNGRRGVAGRRSVASVVEGEGHGR